MTTGSDSLLGRSVGNYVVTGFLGEGGMGQVYLAEHPQIRRRVAIKVLTSQYSEHPQAAERFLGEARAVARIEHANVVDIYDFGSLPDGRLYCVMEVLRGRDLRRVMLDKPKMPATEVWPYMWTRCHDWWVSDLGSSSSTNPVNTSGDAHRLIRGGSYGNPASYLRAAWRHPKLPGEKDGSAGVRCVRTVP